MRLNPPPTQAPKKAPKPQEDSDTDTEEEEVKDVNDPGVPAALKAKQIKMQKEAAMKQKKAKLMR